MIRRLDRRLADEELVEQAPTSDAMAFFGQESEEAPLVVNLLNPAYVDDYAVVLYCPAVQLLATAEAVFKAMWFTFREFKLDLKHGRGEDNSTFLGVWAWMLGSTA